MENNKFRTVLANAFKAGNKKPIGAEPVQASLCIPFETYSTTMVMLQESLHNYVAIQALEDGTEGKADQLSAAKTKVYDLLKGIVDNVPGIICEATDVLYLQLSAYRLAKGKDIENKDGTITIGTKRLVPVSFSSFRMIVESLLGNKISGNTWDVGMGNFRELTAAEREKIAKKLAKKQEKANKPATKPVSPKPAPKEKKQATEPKQAKTAKAA